MRNLPGRRSLASDRLHGGCTYGLWFALAPSPRPLPHGSRSPRKTECGKFAPELCRYRRLNTIFERSNEHLVAFGAIAFISILSRRLKRLVVEELSA
jgi:hypothetical protein